MSAERKDSPKTTDLNELAESADVCLWLMEDSRSTTEDFQDFKKLLEDIKLIAASSDQTLSDKYGNKQIQKSFKAGKELREKTTKLAYKFNQDLANSLYLVLSQNIPDKHLQASKCLPDELLGIVIEYAKEPPETFLSCLTGEAFHNPKIER